MKTLIIEDSAFFRQMLREMLLSRFPSMGILETSNGKEAFEQIGSFRPDIAFMDIELPGENGLTLTKKIRALYPDVVVIILTGYDWPEYREAASRYTRYFLSKGSSSRKEILALVESILVKADKMQPQKS